MEIRVEEIKKDTVILYFTVYEKEKREEVKKEEVRDFVKIRYRENLIWCSKEEYEEIFGKEVERYLEEDVGGRCIECGCDEMINHYKDGNVGRYDERGEWEEYEFIDDGDFELSCRGCNAIIE